MSTLNPRRLTNDDLPRLRQFWIEHWGGEETIARGAINETRKIKPEIPPIGYNNIPLRDEIELEIML